MKQIALMMLAFGLIFSARGQFLKNLTDNIKQTLQNRANGKTNQTTNHLLDKVDSATKIGGSTTSKTATTGGATTTAGTTMAGGTPGATGILPGGVGGQIDTSGFTRVLGAFARTAQENPNDTNQADLVMKSLGRLTGGDGVSPQDSAAAIKSFMTARGGNGVLYQTITTTTSKRGTTRDTNSTWLTEAGEGGSEMRIPMPGAVTPKFIAIGRANEPKYSVLLDAEGKTYSLNIIDTALLHSGVEKYQITRIGTETVGGYSCIHSRCISTVGSGAFKSTSTMDLWTSTSVPGYEMYSKLISFQSSTGGMLGALNAAGAGGFLVKMTAGDGKDFSMTMQLWKADTKSLPASLFEIPTGYAKENQTVASRLMSGSTPAKH